jgi:hypothetical protein
MNRKKRFVFVSGGAVGALAIAAAAVAQSASGSYDLSWRAIAGGGTSEGTPYLEQGVIGQTLAGTSSGSGYSVNSGFLGGGIEKYRRFLPFLSKDGLNN